MKKVLQIAVIMLLFHAGCTSDEDDKKPEVIDGIVQNSEMGKWQDREQFPVKSELIAEYDLSEIEELLISSIGYFQMDEDGNMYFLDSNQLKLLSLHPDGSLRWVSGQEGTGPGDLSMPYGLVLSNGYLYVGNQQGIRIDKFTLDGEFVESRMNTKDIGFGMLNGINEDGEFIFSTPIANAAGVSAKFVSMGDSVEIKHEIEVVEQKFEGRRGSSIGSFELAELGYLYTNSFSYGHRIYDKDGELIGGMDRDFPYLLGGGFYSEEGSSFYVNFGQLNDPVFLDKGYYLMEATYPTNIDDRNSYAKKAFNDNAPTLIKETMLSLYNSEHELLYDLTEEELIDEKYSFSYRGPDGYYYELKSEPVPVIRKFRVTVEE